MAGYEDIARALYGVKEIPNLNSKTFREKLQPLYKGGRSPGNDNFDQTGVLMKSFGIGEGTEPYVYNKPPKHMEYASQRSDHVMGRPFMKSIGMPEFTQERVGAIQSGVVSAVDGLGWGLPRALASKVPGLDHKLSTNAANFSDAESVGQMVGFITSPLHKASRFIGNKLMDKGYKYLPGVADATSLVGLSAVAPTVAAGEPSLDGVHQRAPSYAIANRYFLPAATTSRAYNALQGAKAGVVAQAPAAALSSSPGEAGLNLFDGALNGALLGAGQKGANGYRMFSDAHLTKAQEASKERFATFNGIGALGISGAKAPYMMQSKKQEDTDPRAPAL